MNHSPRVHGHLKMGVNHAGMSQLPGGFTPIPRWTRDPVAGVAEHEATIPDDLASALRRIAGELEMPLSSLLLAAHAKVLATLSGERDVATGYVAAPGGSPLPCRLTTEPDSWRALLLETRRAEAELLSHGHFTEPSFETVFDPAGHGDDLAEDTVLRVGISQCGRRLVARLRYRTGR